MLLSAPLGPTHQARMYSHPARQKTVEKIFSPFGDWIFNVSVSLQFFGISNISGKISASLAMGAPRSLVKVWLEMRRSFSLFFLRANLSRKKSMAEKIAWQSVKWRDGST